MENSDWAWAILPYKRFAFASLHPHDATGSLFAYQSIILLTEQV